MGHFIGSLHHGTTSSIIDVNNVEQGEQTYEHESFTFLYEENELDQVFENEQYYVHYFGECYNKGKLAEKAGISSTNIAEIIAVLFPQEKKELFAQISGKFIVTILDKQNETLYGARDHFGVKPLFYVERDGAFTFSSSKTEITKRYHIDKMNETALQHYFSFQYVPEPYTLHDDVVIMDPATYFVKEKAGKVTFHKYWKPSFDPVQTEKSVWINKIREVMFENIEKRMDGIADIGAFLSGGIDSTLVVSMAKEINPNIKTFSVGFEREGFSEVDIAKETADKVGVENIAKFITADEYVNQIPEIMWNLEEPLADPSCIPLYFVSKEASSYVNFALSGEGSDELFGGYNIYREPDSLRMFNYIPGLFKTLIRKVAMTLPDNMSGKSFLLRGTTPLRERYIGNAKMFEEKEKEAFLKTFNRTISYEDITGPYYDIISHEPLVAQMQYIDIHTWMRGDILLKAGKMSKANGIEIRMPFVDKDVFELASQIPIDLKIANNTTKSILREASRGIIPDHVLDRKKLGFPVPMRHWLKKELNGWAKRIIDEADVDAYVNKQFVRDLLEAHCAGKADYSRKIWTFLMFMVWHQVFMEGKYDFTQEQSTLRG